MRQGFMLAMLCVAVTTPTVGGQDAKPFANLELEGKSRWITYMAFSPDGKTFAASHLLESWRLLRDPVGRGQRQST